MGDYIGLDSLWVIGWFLGLHGMDGLALYLVLICWVTPSFILNYPLKSIFSSKMIVSSEIGMWSKQLFGDLVRFVQIAADGRGGIFFESCFLSILFSSFADTSFDGPDERIKDSPFDFL